MKIILLFSVAFLIEALVVQFRYEYVSATFKANKSRELADDQYWGNMPDSGYSEEDFLRTLAKREKARDAEKKSGRKAETEGNLLFELWIKEQKKNAPSKAAPFYAVSILFLLAAFVKKVGVFSDNPPKAVE